MEQVFVGREDELVALSEGVSAAAGWQSGVCWIEADAGFGKTALIRRAIAALPKSVTVLSAESDELGRDAPFGVAAALGASTSADSFSVGLDLLRVFGEHADDGPVLVVVEDLHWADSGSRESLLTAARRIERDRVCMWVTSRPTRAVDGWARLADDEQRCRKLELEPLTIADVSRWASRAGIALSTADAVRLHEHTGGHPLYVRTLLRELTPEQLAATGELPAPRSLASATVAALAELSPEANQLASALAVLGQRTPLPELAAMAGIAEPVQALEHLLGTGFVRWQPGEQSTPVEFVHPLYRLAVYDDLSPTRRQLLHRAAADQLGRVGGLPHRVAAADGFDGDLATELEQGAADEMVRGATAVAAKYLLWSVALTASREVAENRLLRAARLLLADGRLDRVTELLPRIRACEPGPLRDLVLGSHAYETGDSATAQRLLAGVASADDEDATVSADANVRLSSIYLMQSEPRRQAAAAAAALTAATSGDDMTRTAWRSLASAEFTLNGAAAGLAVLARRLPSNAEDVDGPDAELLVVRGLLRLYGAQTRAGIVDLRAAIHMSRAGFSHQHLPAAHVYLARALFITGDWDEAQVHARTAQTLVADERHRWIRGRPEFVLGTIAASRGQWDEAAGYLAAAERSAVVDLDTAWPDLLGHVLRSAVSRARGDAAGVVAALRPLATDTRVVISQMAVVAWWPILIQGLLDSGETDYAAYELEKLERHVEATEMELHGQLAGLRARLAAVRNDPDEALRLFALATATIRPDDPLIDRGLLAHRYGRLLHAKGARRNAVERLRVAHELFAGVGAEPYRLAVAADLESCGIRSAPDARSQLQLTEREQDVVALVRRGMTNREVAAEMYVSEKAVEYHLSNVYAKLGITSRRELR